jgi:hypothetical protein
MNKIRLVFQIVCLALYLFLDKLLGEHIKSAVVERQGVFSETYGPILFFRNAIIGLLILGLLFEVGCGIYRYVRR